MKIPSALHLFKGFYKITFCQNKSGIGIKSMPGGRIGQSLITLQSRMSSKNRVQGAPKVC